MKNIFKISAILCLLLLTSITTYAADGAQVSATLIRSEPFPLIIGEDANIFFKITNSGDKELPNVVVEYVPEFPFIVRDTQQIRWSLKELAGGDDQRFSFQLKVDERATRGKEKLTFRISSKDISFDDEISVSLREQEQVLEIKKITLDPESLAPGEKGKLLLVFDNNADSLVRDLDISIGISGDTILPTGSTSSKRIDIIPKDSEFPVIFSVKALETAASSTYKLTINWSYQDEAGSSFSNSEVSSLTIGGKPLLDVVLDETDILKSGKLGSATISILNKGLINAKFVLVKIKKNDNFTLLDPDETYVGDIQSDDFETIEYKIFLKSDIVGVAIIPVTVEYNSPDGKSFVLQKNIEIPLYSNQQIAQLGLEQKSNTGTIVFLGIVLVVAVVGYRWWKKKKQHHQ